MGLVTFDSGLQNKIGIIGFGFLGTALAHGFALHADIKIYDKYSGVYDKLEETVNESDFIFVGVPTPMRDNGSQDLSSMDDAVESVVAAANKKKIIVLRSTIIPGTTRGYAEKYPEHEFVFVPEFLTERNAKLDFINSARIIIGGGEAVWDVEELYRLRFTHTPIYTTTWEAAEVVKYMCNCFFAVKISFLNEIFDIAETTGESYENIRDMFLSDFRIGNSHTDVPGHDGDRGYGGKCLVAGTKLLTEDKKIVCIEDICVGDKVFDGESFTEITGIAYRTVDNTIEVISRGRAIHGSEDHIHFVYRDNNLVEVELKDITEDDYIFVPEIVELSNKVFIPMENPNNRKKVWHDILEITPDVARLMGLYLAEGCSGIYNGKREIFWSFGSHEERLANEVCSMLVSLGLNPYKRYQVTDGTYGTSRCWVIRCRSMWLHMLFEKLELGSNASNKNTPLFRGDIAKYLIGGWLEGDGCYSGNTIEGYSDSVDLIHSIDTMLLSLGINAGIAKKGKAIRISTRKEVEEVSRWVNRFEFNNLNYKTDVVYASPTMKKVGGGWITKVKNVNKLPGEFVYSIETESHRYTANNLMTHNCFPKDVQAFVNWAESKGLKADMCKAADEVNTRVRKNKDWLCIKGATSENNYV